MCRSIKTLRPPYVEEATSDDVTAAALQYVRKIAGMRKPSAVNQQAFDEAVADIAAATEHLLGHLQVRPAPAARELSPAGNASRDLSPAGNASRDLSPAGNASRDLSRK